MMNKQTLKKPKVQSIDLNLLDGEGSFACPNCGARISPDDESNESYKIIDTKVVGDELVGLLISCGTCGTRLRLTGFEQVIDGSLSE
jgi:hypothetical protein